MELIKLLEIRYEESAEKWLQDKGILKKFSSSPRMQQLKNIQGKGEKIQMWKVWI
jgi:hypothetical protein